MIRLVDNFLDRITMYRLTLYCLISFLLAALILAGVGTLPFSPASLLFSAALLTLFSWLANTLFARIFSLPANAESVYITALILALIISPPRLEAFWTSMPFLVWVAVWAQAAKYLINFGGKHIFNPAAFAVALTALTINQSASWWVGAASMLPFSLIGGLLIIRKVRRFDAALVFSGSALLTAVLLAWGRGNVFLTLERLMTYSPLIFFAGIMLTEPMTMPPGRRSRLVYGFLVGWLFAPQTHLGSFYFTPELALLAGNLYSYLVSPKGRYIFKLVGKRKIGENVYDFVFQAPKRMNFQPGQYMEWTLGLKGGDSRGNRRYFTLASSPTEDRPRLGVKFYQNASRYKQEMLNMQVGDKIIAGQLAGDFVLPKNLRQKLVLVAGGIGITPYRSMLRFLLDRNEKRPIRVLFSNRISEEIVYADVLEAAREKLGIDTVYTLTDLKQIPAGWRGLRGHFDAKTIAREIPDYETRVFYVSGSYKMVTGFKDSLLKLGIRRARIKTDFFPGLV